MLPHTFYIVDCQVPHLACQVPVYKAYIIVCCMDLQPMGLISVVVALVINLTLPGVSKMTYRLLVASFLLL